MKKLILLIALAGTLFSAQISQNVSTVNAAHTNGEFDGQSFTATGNDTITSIDVAYDNAVVGTITLRIYNGQTNCDNGGGGATAGAISTTAGLSVADTNPAGLGEGDLSAGFYSTLTLGTPLAITNGSQYTFCLENGSGGVISYALNSGNPYAGGQVYWHGLGFQAADDMGFRINVAATATAPLSKNVLILLFLGFLTIGMYGLRSQKV